ncbi:MAG: beta-ketoacyl synthase N-terminal-like domain-containing protein [bacterium]
MSADIDPRDSFVVTGMGAVSALGRGCAALWDAIRDGRDGIRPITRFPTDEFHVHLAAEVPPDAGFDTNGNRCVAYALAAAAEAWDEARVAEADLPSERIALVLGTNLGHSRAPLQTSAEALAAELGIGGPRLTISTACSSSTNALGLARDLLRAGVADLVLAGGSDELSPELFAGFHALGVLSQQKCAPFSQPVGTTMAEGAGFVVLESARQAHRRRVKPLATLSGYGLASDAYHETSPDPRGAGVARALRAAVEDAGIEPHQIGYVNAHGTGTAANDPAEWLAVQRVFAGVAVPAISSTKSYFGHAQGAAGILEIITTVLAMGQQQLPPTLHFAGPRKGCPEDPVAQDRPRAWSFDHALSSSSAFGGANAAVVLSRPDAAVAPSPRERRAVRVLGVGAVGPHGTELVELVRALEAGAPLDGRVPGFDIEEIVRGVDPRGMDPASRYLTAATARALEDAGIRVRGKLRDRAGIVVGATSMSPTSAREFLGSIERRGLSRLSAAAFARMVLNAPAGSCSVSHELKGPISTLTTGAGSGLAAVVYAALLLATRRDADLLVAGGFDELGEIPGSDPSGSLPLPTGEGAGCLVLAAGETWRASASHSGIVIAGIGLSGPGRPRRAVEQALDMAGRSVDQVELVVGRRGDLGPEAFLGEAGRSVRFQDPSAVLGVAHAASSAHACVAAVLALREGSARTALVASSDGQSACSAVVLTRQESALEP